MACCCGVRCRFLAGRVGPFRVSCSFTGPDAWAASTSSVTFATSCGLAVLSYDKRGVGASSGVYEQRGGDGAEATLRRLAGDAARAFDALSATSGVDRERLGLFGASQAGWVIPLAAELTRTPPKFHVILSGPAVSTGAEQYYSDLTSDGTGPPPVSDRAEVERLTLAFNGRPGFDPLPFLKATRVPTLWLLGARDMSVPTFASVRALEAIRQAGNDSHTVIQYATADHSLRDVDSGRPVPLWDDVMRWLTSRGLR
jgi:pimeloyl-ACP methyl ester carboxylesterase